MLSNNADCESATQAAPLACLVMQQWTCIRERISEAACPSDKLQFSSAGNCMVPGELTGAQSERVEPCKYPSLNVLSPRGHFAQKCF